jgi:hypothetical protein
MVLLPLMEFGIGHQVHIVDQLSVAAHSLVEVADSAAMSAPRVKLSAAGVVLLEGLVPRNGGPIQTEPLAARAAKRLADASPADRTRVRAALSAAGPAERQYVLEVLAAGHSADEVVRFAQLIRGRRPQWLRRHLSLVDPSGPVWVTYRASRVQQTDDTACGSMSILMARAMADPLYTLYLTTGGSTSPAAASAEQFQARLAAEEQRIHDATNRFWPQRLGSTPSGVSTELNKYADALGTHYEPRLVTRALGSSALRDAVTAADSAQLVPVLIGDWIPRHYVLLIGRDKDGLLFYEPIRGRLTWVTEQEFLKGSVGALGFQHVYAVIAPSR